MYPPRNPFPGQATKAIEGASGYDLDQLTLARSSVVRIRELAARYRDSYDPTGEGSGLAVAVHGEHGSGKTHVLACAITELAPSDSGLPGGSSGRDVLTIYVRADGPDVLALYRKLMSQLTRPLLRQLSARAQAEYAAQEFAASRGLDRETALATVGLGTDWVATAFEAADLQATAVLDRQRQDLVRQGLRREDFERVIPNLLNRDLSELARRWLCGEVLDDAELRHLGIARNIDSSLKVRMGFQALLTLSLRAGQPIAIVIDQAESFVTTTEGALFEGNAGILRAIVESVSGNSGFFGLGITEAAWQVLPSDLRQRFGPSEITTARLTESEATDLVALHVQPWASDGGSPTFPFLHGGLRVALRASGGNVRRFVQSCSALFAAAAPDARAIDGEFAREALAGDAEPILNGEAVRARLGELLTVAHVPFASDFPVGDSTVDFAVRDATDRVKTCVLVADALFDPADFDAARRRVESAKTLRSESFRPDVVLVAAGYLAPDLLPRLGDVHRVIVVTAFDDAELAGLVSGLKTTAAEGAIADAVALRQRLAEVQESLGRLEIARTREGERGVTGLGAAIREWQETERTIRKRINTERHARQKAELDEMERARAHAQMRRWTYLLVAVPVALVLVAVNLAIAEFHLSPLNSFLLHAALLTAATGILGSFPLFDAGIYRPKGIRRIVKPVDSIEELSRLALDYQRRFGDSVHKTNSHMGGIIMQDSLTSRNPHIRYAAVGRSKASLDDLAAALSAEQTAIVRRHLIQRIVKVYSKDGLKVVLKNLADDPAVTTAFDYIKPTDVTFDPRFRTLAALYGWKQNENTRERQTENARDWLEQFIKSLNSADRKNGNFNDRNQKSQRDVWQRGISNLVNAYLSDKDEDLLPALSSTPRREFRFAAANLSPFDDGTLGAYDWLRKIDQIDEMYLFFTKCQFYVERGVTAPLPGDP
jgi:hypothetical protein